MLLEGVVDHLTKQIESGGSHSLPGSTAEMSQLIIDFCIASYETLLKTSRKSLPTTLEVNGTAEEPPLQSPTWQFALIPRLLWSTRQSSCLCVKCFRIPSTKLYVKSRIEIH